MFPRFDAIRCHNGQVNDAFLIAGHLEEHLGFHKENAIDLEQNLDWHIQSCMALNALGLVCC